MPTDDVKLMGNESIAFDEETLVAFIAYKFHIDYPVDPPQLRLKDIRYTIEDFPPQLIAYLEDNTDKFVLPNIYGIVGNRLALAHFGDHSTYIGTLLKYEIPQIDCKDLCDVIAPIYQKALANPNAESTINWIQKSHFKLYNYARSEVDGNLTPRQIEHALWFLDKYIHESVEKVAKIIKFTAGKPTIFITNDGDYLAFRDELKEISKGMLTIADIEEIKLGTTELINKYKVKPPVEHVYHKPTNDDLRNEISKLLERISNDNMTAAENQYIKELKSPNRGKQILAEIVSK